jgi:hypothetical protein
MIITSENIGKTIDYARAKAKSPALKAALTRAKKQVGTAHYPAVLAACKAAVAEWDIWEHGQMAGQHGTSHWEMQHHSTHD